MSIESPIPTNSLSSYDLMSTQMESLWLSRSLSRQNNSTTPGFTLSSNPPNPRVVFRMGDWMYEFCLTFPFCVVASDDRNHFKGVPPPTALPTILGESSSPCPYLGFNVTSLPSPLFPQRSNHVFPPRRNFTCIGCGYPRPSTSHVPLACRTSLNTISPAQVPSPRFVGSFETQMPPSLSHRIPHILTPSGRAFSVGGRVQDVSSDPLSSCFMFWPDNEPLPEQGQIRRNTLDGVPVRIATCILSKLGQLAFAASSHLKYRKQRSNRAPTR
jgi:hypothetical protein